MRRPERDPPGAVPPSRRAGRSGWRRSSSGTNSSRARGRTTSRCRRRAGNWCAMRSVAGRGFGERRVRPARSGCWDRGNTLTRAADRGRPRRPGWLSVSLEPGGGRVRDEAALHDRPHSGSASPPCLSRPRTAPADWALPPTCCPFRRPVAPSCSERRVAAAGYGSGAGTAPLRLPCRRVTMASGRPEHLWVWPCAATVRPDAFGPGNTGCHRGTGRKCSDQAEQHRVARAGTSRHEPPWSRNA